MIQKRGTAHACSNYAQLCADLEEQATAKRRSSAAPRIGGVSQLSHLACGDRTSSTQTAVLTSQSYSQTRVTAADVRMSQRLKRCSRAIEESTNINRDTKKDTMMVRYSPSVYAIPVGGRDSKSKKKRKQLAVVIIRGSFAVGTFAAANVPG